mmetsp:Transcript_15822/g.31758  ORF Transcript_15822/g.31758 Transcript_15822/m.31758 type:complete len:173 (-) Transcript_15822:1542-2060(-)
MNHSFEEFLRRRSIISRVREEGSKSLPDRLDSTMAYSSAHELEPSTGQPEGSSSSEMLGSAFQQNFIEQKGTSDRGTTYRAPEQSKLAKAGSQLCFPSHLGDGHVQCSECNKQFASTSSLNRHMRFVHRNERKFECEFCDSKSFPQKTDLAKHITRVHATRKKPKFVEDVTR